MDKFEELRKFKELFDDGIISKEEFEIKKKELLAITNNITHDTTISLLSCFVATKDGSRSRPVFLSRLFIVKP